MVIRAPALATVSEGVRVTPSSGHYHKYTVGAELRAREGARRVLKKLIVRANGRRDKAPVLLDRARRSRRSR